MLHLPKLYRRELNGLKILLVFAIAIFLLCGSAPSPFDNRIYSQTSNAYRFYATAPELIIDIASDNELNLFIIMMTGKIVSIDSVNHQKIWETEMGGQIISKPLAFEENLLVAGKSQSALVVRALAKSTGITRWQLSIPFENEKLGIVEKIHLYEYENQVIIAADRGAIYSLNQSDGQIVWKKNLGHQLSAIPFLENDKLFFGSVDKRIIGLFAADGKQFTDLAMNAEPTFITGGENREFLTIGDNRGNLMQINWRSKSQKRRFKFGGEICAISQTSNGLLVSSVDNFIYLLANEKDQLIWKKRLAGRIAGAPLFDEAYIVVTTTEANVASVIDLHTGRLVNRVALGKDDFFTGKSLHFNDFFVYSTHDGFLSFKLNGNGNKKA